MFCAGHTHLYDGNLFIAGGHESKWIDFVYRDGLPNPPDQPVAEWNKADGMMNANVYSGPMFPWAAKDMMAWKRWYPTCTPLYDGRVLVNGGSYLTPVLDAQNRVMKYDTHFVTVPEIFDPGAT